MLERPTFRYILDQLEEVKTESDLNYVKNEVKKYLPLDQYEENFDVNSAIDNVKRDYKIK